MASLLKCILFAHGPSNRGRLITIYTAVVSSTKAIVNCYSDATGSTVGSRVQDRRGGVGSGGGSYRSTRACIARFSPDVLSAMRNARPCRPIVAASTAAHTPSPVLRFTAYHATADQW
eukprot:1189033-Prorocentrum_minimum.AAC.1